MGIPGAHCFTCGMYQPIRGGPEQRNNPNAFSQCDTEPACQAFSIPSPYPVYFVYPCLFQTRLELVDQHLANSEALPAGP